MKAVVSLLLLASIPTHLLAQATASLGRPEPEWSVQFGVGTGVPAESYGQQMGATRAALVSLRRTTAGPMVLRFDGWLIQRKPGQFATSIYTYDAQRGYSVGRRLEDARFLALVAGGAFPMRLGPDVSIEPVIGLGYVPFARGTYGGDDSVQPISQSSTGFVLPVGLSLHLWRFAIEHHLLLVFGADGAVGNGENAPLMVSYRLFPW